LELISYKSYYITLLAELKTILLLLPSLAPAKNAGLGWADNASNTCGALFVAKNKTSNFVGFAQKTRLTQPTKLTPYRHTQINSCFL
jgi:hypothetical protein